MRSLTASALILVAGHDGGLKGQYDCIHEFSEADFTEDIKKIDRSMLIIHVDDDQIAPIGAADTLSFKLVPGATPKVYKAAPHGHTQTHQDKLNAELLAFIKT